MIRQIAKAVGYVFLRGGVHMPGPVNVHGLALSDGNYHYQLTLANDRNERNVYVCVFCLPLRPLGGDA